MINLYKLIFDIKNIKEKAMVQRAAHNGAVCRNGGCGSWVNICGKSPFLPRSKRVETRHCGKPLGR
jgi:hypothetical protein